mmetsp:Transcript_43080/g.48165  ORF Transcript_43080/g.48165 Transcript_43080/m.48165 type:complete len:451 (-) Transcript_43080:236-1588(-)
MFVTAITRIPTILLLLLLLLSAAVVVQVVMSEAIYAPPSLIGKPIKALIGPGNCQLREEEWIAIPLLARIPVVVSKTSSSSTSTSTSTASLSSYVLRFGPLPNKLLPLNLSTCACILAKGKIRTASAATASASASASATPSETGTQDGDDEKGSIRTTTTTTTDVIRPYTPISTNNVRGCFDLLIKDYGGAGLSHHLCHTLQVGETIDFQHTALNVKIQAPFQATNIIMLVGGTGITPMIQALHAILGSDNDDDTDAVPVDTNKNEKKQKVILLYGSRTEDEILGRRLIDTWAKDYPKTFIRLVHVVSSSEEETQQQPKKESVRVCNESSDSESKAATCHSSSYSSSTNNQSKKKDTNNTNTNIRYGYIDKQLIQEHVALLLNDDQDTASSPEESESDADAAAAAAAADLLFFVCGPPAMYQALCEPREEKEISGILQELGYTEQQVYKF